MENTASFELEIQRLLIAKQTPNLIANTILGQAVDADLSEAEVRTISRFCLSAGELPELVKFLLKRLTEQKRIPWDYFVEALFQSCAAIPEDLKKLIIRGAESQDALSELMNVHHLDYFDERISQLRDRRSEEAEDRARKLKSKLLDELELMKNQHLERPQKAHLQKLDRLFPDDSKIQKLVKTHQEQRILESLAKKPSRSHARPYIRNEAVDAETLKTLAAIDLSMEDFVSKNPDMALDFSISHLMWENHRSALHFLEKSPESATRGWLKAHLLLAARRFVDLLNQINEIEALDQQNPEAAFEAIYLRAQAHWGLGDKIVALELMESLLEQRPDYRAGSSLLVEWKDSLL